ELGKEGVDRGLRTVVLTDGDDAQPSIVAMRGGELVQRRQFLDARSTPGGPQVHEHGYALELGKGDVAAIGVLEDGVGRGLAPVASVDAFDRCGLGWCGRFIRGLLRLLLRAGSECDEGQWNEDETHARGASAMGEERLVGADEGARHDCGAGRAARRLRQAGRPPARCGETASGEAADGEGDADAGRASHRADLRQARSRRRAGQAFRAAQARPVRPCAAGRQRRAGRRHRPAARRQRNRTRDSAMTNRVRKAVFPVAGLGTRLLPATKSIPKEMITIVDRPLIQYAVDEAREAGIEEMIFVTGRGKVTLVDYFDVAYELEA